MGKTGGDWSLYLMVVVERGGFEPPVCCHTHAFQACALSHSAIPPARSVSRLKREPVQPIKTRPIKNPKTPSRGIISVPRLVLGAANLSDTSPRCNKRGLARLGESSTFSTGCGKLIDRVTEALIVATQNNRRIPCNLSILWVISRPTG